MAIIGIWFGCDRTPENPFNDTHQSRILETGCNRVIVSRHYLDATYDLNSEKDVAQWAKGNSSRPRMIPGQTRADNPSYLNCLNQWSRRTFLYDAHKVSGHEAELAEQSYDNIRSEIDGVEGFLVYHEAGTCFSGLTPVMDKLTQKFKADRGYDPELWAVEDRTKTMEWDDFYSIFWYYSNNTVFMSERYNWVETWSEQKRIEEFEKPMTDTAEDARIRRNQYACRWTAIVAAHRDEYRKYYTPNFEELRFTSLLPIGLGAEGIVYFVFDWTSNTDCTDDIYRNSATRQNISNLKPRINWLEDRLNAYTYSGWKYNTTDGGWESFPESEYIDRIEENQGDFTSWRKKLIMGFWEGAAGHEAWPITSRDPWTGNYSYTVYFKKNTHVIWEGEDKGILTQFSFTMPPGDTKLLELGPEIY